MESSEATPQGRSAPTNAPTAPMDTSPCPRHLPALASLLLEAIKDLCQADSASILELQEDHSLVFTFVDGGAADRLRGLRLPAHEGAAGRVMSTGQPEIVTCPSPVSERIAKTFGYTTHCLLVAPLIDRAGNRRGVVEAVNSLEGGFRQEHLRALLAIAAPLAEAVSAIDALESDPQAITRFYHAVVEVMQARGADLKDRNHHLVRSRRSFELDRARRYSDERMAGLARFACGLAHEINNPLGAVQSNLTTAATLHRDLRQRLAAVCRVQGGRAVGEIGELLQELDDIARDAREGLSRIARIVGRLTAFGETDPGRAEEVALDEEARRLAELFRMRPLLATPVEVEVSSEGQVAVVANRTQVRQVLVEVMENAVRAAEQAAARTPPTAAPRVILRPFADERFAHLTITDNGPGIPPDQLERIFDPFFTTKPHWRATGLGLTAAYGIVRALGGSIAVDSRPDEGTSVTVSLPLSPAHSQPTARRARTGRYYVDLK